MKKDFPQNRSIDSIRIEKAVTESAAEVAVRKNRIEIAKTLLAKKMPIDFIIEISQLPIEDIEKIQRNEELDIY